MEKNKSQESRTAAAATALPDIALERGTEEVRMSSIGGSYAMNIPSNLSSTVLWALFLLLLHHIKNLGRIYYRQIFLAFLAALILIMIVMMKMV